MRAPRADVNPELAGHPRASRGSQVAALLDFAITQITKDQPLHSTLPAVLDRFTEIFGLRAAIVLLPAADQSRNAQLSPAVLAAYPPDAGRPELLARIGRLPRQQSSARLAPALLPIRLGGRAREVLVVYPPPADGHSLCAVALINDGTGWDEQVRATAHAVATLISAQLRDATKLAQKTIQADDEACWLDSLIAMAIPGVLITDEYGAVTRISESFSTMFGIDQPDPLTGTPAIRLIRRVQHLFADPAEFVRRTVATLRAAKPSSGEQIATADGRTIESDYWPVFVDGRYRGAIWLLWDMSDRAELDRQRDEQNAHLRELDKARNDFVAMISHELRTPLTSIVSFSELIKGEAAGLTVEGQHFLDIIERNADRMLRLIGDLMLLSRLDAGFLPLDLARVSVPDLVNEAVRASTQIAAIQDITLVASTGAGPPVLGDSRRLHQVLDNLIGNAIKFSHRRAQVVVTARYDGRTWRIDVTDTGIGIPPGEAARLFGRFVRASNARIAGLPGTGLGLAIVKTIVEMHDGRIDVATALDQGSTLSVYLPPADTRTAPRGRHEDRGMRKATR